MHHLWSYKHQHDNPVRSKLSVACQRWWFQWRFWFVPSVPGYLREEDEHKPDPWRNPIERNHMGLHPENEVVRRVASDHHKGCTYRAPVRYVTNTWSVVLLNKKIHILLSQVYCVWQVVKTLTIISNNPEYYYPSIHQIFQVVSFLQVPTPKPCTHASFLPCVPRTPPISPSFIWSSWWYVVSCTNHEAPHCAFFSNLLLLPPF